MTKILRRNLQHQFCKKRFMVLCVPGVKLGRDDVFVQVDLDDGSDFRNRRQL